MSNRVLDREPATVGAVADRPRWNLPSPWRKLLLAVHVATTVSVLGADLVLVILGISSMGGADARPFIPPRTWLARGWSRHSRLPRSAPVCCWAC